MANLNAHFDVKRQARRQLRAPARKWSARRSIGFALLASAALWIAMFWVAKAALV